MMKTMDELTAIMQEAQAHYDQACETYEIHKRDWVECPCAFSQKQLQEARNILKVAAELLEMAQEQIAEDFDAWEMEE